VSDGRLYRLHLFSDDPLHTIGTSFGDGHRVYQVVGMERSGERILVSFVDSPDYISVVSLPRPDISDEDIRRINADPNDFCLIYKGYVHQFRLHKLIVVGVLSRSDT
jgi:hypothetical protein